MSSTNGNFVNSRNNSFSMQQQHHQSGYNSEVNGRYVTNGSNGGHTQNTSGYNNSSILSALNNTSSMLENSFDRSSDSVGVSRSEEDRLTWLQKQQRKLQERREEQKKSHQESNYLIKELKTSLQRARSGGTETTDGYASDLNSLCQYSETSRESSPAKQSFSVPLTVETTEMANSENLYSSVQKRSQTPTL